MRTKLVRELFELPPIGEHGIRARPLYGTWEGNMGHALDRKPVDICLQRNEPKVVIGNAGVVKILEVGSKVKNVEPGQNAVILATGTARSSTA